MIYLTFLLPAFFGMASAAKDSGDHDGALAFFVCGGITAMMLLLSILVELILT